MADPLTIFSAVTGGMQLAIQVKEYLEQRKRRKQQNTPQQITHHHFHHHIGLPSTVTTYLSSSNYLPWHPPPQALVPYQYSGSRWDLQTIGGRIDALAPAQQAPHFPNFQERIGIRTGRDPNPRNSLSLAQNHWRAFQQLGTALATPNLSPAIAVMDWDAGNVDMFVESEGVYYRNYQVKACNVVAFAKLYQTQEIFSGELKDGMLVRCNKEIKVRELFEFEHSTNSWMLLGLTDDINDSNDNLFFVMVVGAMLGILCCLYESPWELNVDMESSRYNPNQTVARINSHKPLSRLRRRSSTCRFSVFSFCNNGGNWASQEVCIG